MSVGDAVHSIVAREPPASSASQSAFAVCWDACMRGRHWVWAAGLEARRTDRFTVAVKVQWLCIEGKSLHA